MLSNDYNPYLPSTVLRPVLGDTCLQFLRISAQPLFYSVGCICSYFVWLATIFDVYDISGFLLRNRDGLSFALLFTVFHYFWIRTLFIATFQLPLSKYGFMSGLLFIPVAKLYGVFIDYSWPAEFISNEVLYICIAQLPLVLLSILVELCIAFSWRWTFQKWAHQDVKTVA